MNSTEIIEKAKQRFKELEHKEYEWKSFFNGFLEGCSFMFSAEKELKKNRNRNKNSKH